MKEGRRSYIFDSTVCGADDEIRIENLKPSTKYIVKVGAKNEVGVGRFFELDIETEEPRKYCFVARTTFPDLTGSPA